MEIILYIVLAAIVIDIVFALYIIFFRKRKITGRDLEEVRLHIRRAKGLRNGEKVMEMDKILDQVLWKLGYRGSLADKLRKSEKLFSDYNGVWEAHKLRNKVAHEVGYKVSKDQAGKAGRQFERAFRDLGVL